MIRQNFKGEKGFKGEIVIEGSLGDTFDFKGDLRDILDSNGMPDLGCLKGLQMDIQ